MIKYAITGGIASGKTTTLSLFKFLGIKTINTDIIVYIHHYILIYVFKHIHLTNYGDM